MPKLIIYFGITLIIIGLIWHFFGDKLSWIGNLPGDIKIDKGNTKIFFPITTMILVSILFSFIMWFIRRFF